MPKASLEEELQGTRQSILRRGSQVDPLNQPQTTLILGVAAVGSPAEEELLQSSRGCMIVEYVYSQSGLPFLLILRTALSAFIAHSEIRRRVPT